MKQAKRKASQETEKRIQFRGFSQTFSNDDCRFWHFVSLIPKGKVVSYKDLALVAGIKNPRHVGRKLHTNNNPNVFPCHRVVRSDGVLASGYRFGGLLVQKAKLIREGVIFRNKKVCKESFFSFEAL